MTRSQTPRPSNRIPNDESAARTDAQDFVDGAFAMVLSESAESGNPHVSAQHVCHAVVDLAKDLHTHDHRDFLHSIGIRRSEDVGAIINQLIELEFARRSPDDREQDFVNQFDLG